MSIFNCGNFECFPINGKLSDLANVTLLRHCAWFKKKVDHFIALNVSKFWKVYQKRNICTGNVYVHLSCQLYYCPQCTAL